MCFVYMIFFQVENLVAVELAYINTKHPDFHDATLVNSMIKASIAEDVYKQQPRKQPHAISLDSTNSPAKSALSTTDATLVNEDKFLPKVCTSICTFFVLSNI